MRSTTEFAIHAFVVYPLLPAESVALSVQFEPRVAWVMVVFVAGIGIVNYAIVTTYGSRGIAVTGFFGLPPRCPLSARYSITAQPPRSRPPVDGERRLEVVIHI